jgi:hypothetical protein
VLTYAGKLISTYFSSSSGGYLTNSAWSDTSSPAYLVAKPDPWSLKAPRAPWNLPLGYAWTVTISPASLATKLSGSVSVGTITKVEVVTRDTADADSHARTVRITGSTGTATITARSFKSLVGLKSTLILSIAKDNPLTRYQQADSHFVYAGTWAVFSTASASGGSYRRANTSGASVTVKFTGTYLAWIATKGTTLGKAYVSLDGGTKVSVNLAASAVAYQQNVWNTGTLTTGAHTVKIWWDTANTAGKYISVDAFDVSGTLN